jgi:large subunit ribosomal protein L15
MQINQIKRIHPNKKRMIVARGGKRGKTAGRGGKGQSARAGNKRRPEWRDIIKRLPKLRGRGKNSNKSFAERNTIVNLSSIEAVFSSGENVSPKTLVDKGVISMYSGKIPAVKILGDGEISKSVIVTGCQISGSAVEKITKAGGKVEIKKTVEAPKEESKKVETPKETKIENKEDKSEKKVAKKAPKKETK